MNIFSIVQRNGRNIMCRNILGVNLEPYRGICCVKPKNISYWLHVIPWITLGSTRHFSNTEFSEKEDDVFKEIPDITFEPVRTPVDKLRLCKATYVVIDLETTGFIQKANFPHITQIAAVEVGTGDIFSKYVKPQKMISPGAGQVTGMSWDGSNLYVRDVVVEAEEIHSALASFSKWIAQYENVVLIAHNGWRFDFKILTRTASECQLNSLLGERICGFVDSLDIFRSKVPNLKSYAQGSLVKHLLEDPDFNAHNAVDDVLTLRKLLHCVDVSNELYYKCSYSPEIHIKQELRSAALKANILTLHDMVSKNVMDTKSAENIASSGLNKYYLKLIWNRGGHDALINTFQQNSGGKELTICPKKDIAKIVSKMCTYFRNL